MDVSFVVWPYILPVIWLIVSVIPMQGRRKLFSIGPAGYGGGSRNLRVEGGTPLAQLGGMGERCKLPHWGLGRSPRSQRFLRSKKLRKRYKKATARRPLK